MKLFSCKLTGHTLKEISNTTIYTKEFECVKCKQQYTTDGYGKLVRLTQYWKENNKYFSSFSKNEAKITL